MARKFQTSDIVAPVKARFSKRSLTHINTAFDDLSDDVVKAMIGSNYTTGDVVVLHGCVVTATIPGTSSITAGAVYYNGRVYKVDANASLITTGLQTLVWGIVETTITGDPAIFDDGNTYDFHIIEKFALSAGLSGSGLANYNQSTVKRVHGPYKKGSDVASVTMSAAGTVSIAQTYAVKSMGMVTIHGQGIINPTAGFTEGTEFYIELTLTSDFHLESDNFPTDFACLGLSNITFDVNGTPNTRDVFAVGQVRSVVGSDTTIRVYFTVTYNNGDPLAVNGDASIYFTASYLAKYF